MLHLVTRCEQAGRRRMSGRLWNNISCSFLALGPVGSTHTTMLAHLLVATLAAVAVAVAAPEPARFTPIEGDIIPIPTDPIIFPAPLLPEGVSCHTKRVPCAKDACYRCCGASEGGWTDGR